MKEKEMPLRKSLLKDYCQRCGNDLETGGFPLHLPHEKQYIMLCRVCYYGLALELYASLPLVTQPLKPSEAQHWKEFWATKIPKNEK